MPKRPPRLTAALRGPALGVALLLPACTASPEGHEHHAPASPSTAPADRMVRAVPFTQVQLTDDFWRPRLETNRTVTIPHIMQQNIDTGRVANLERGAGLRDGAYEGRRFNDTDVYKLIEAASYSLSQSYDATLDAEIDRLIEIIAAAQQEDGYLFPAYTIDPDNPALGVGTERWVHVSAGSHELYNAGHLIEAAVAHHLATDKRTLLDVAVRFADLIDREFGPDARHDIPGHEEIELALVKLADLTGEGRYVDLARFFIDQRGQEHDGIGYDEASDFAIYNGRPYKQDHAPVVEQSRASGHAVRAGYLYTGMADVAARRDDTGYEAALERIWTDVVSTKLYLTGGIGSRGTFESFGEDYELPNASAYTESCAAVGNDLWNHRMFLATGEARYLDVMERVLYNGTLSGVSLAGDSFFYTNPLESDGDVQRSEYFDVACCPANLARLMALLPGFVYAQQDDELFVNLYVGSQARIELPGTDVEVQVETDYPWNGEVRVTIQPRLAAVWTLALRIPGWARNEPVASDLYRFDDNADHPVALTVNGQPLPGPGADARRLGDAGWLRVRRQWRPGDVVELTLPMPTRRVRAHEAVEATRGRLALQRGPLVYAAEAADNDGRVLDLALAGGDIVPAFDAATLGGVVTLRAPALRAGEPTTLTAVPYFAWANRGAGEMVVWLPREQ